MAASASAPSTTRGPGRLNQAEASTAQTAPRVAAGSARQAGWSQSRRAWAATASNEKPQGRAHVLGANIELRGLDENPRAAHQALGALHGRRRGPPPHSLAGAPARPGRT